MYNNGGIVNVIGIGPSSPTHNASPTEPSRVASCTMKSRSMQQPELCRTPLLEEFLQYHRHKRDPRVVPETCGPLVRGPK